MTGTTFEELPLTPSASRPLKVAVLSFAHTHAIGYCRALAGRADIDLVVADPDGASAPDEAPRGAELAAELGVRYLETYEEALAWAPDAVIVTAENARHRALVEASAAVGAHILCEKPLATTVEDAEAMLAAAERAGVTLMTAYPVRFAPSFADLLHRVRSGQLGTVLAVKGTNNGKLPAERAWFTDPALSGGGALVDHVVHCADLLDELLGEQPSTVHAVANRLLHPESAVETGGLVTAVYPSGVVATIDCSWSVPQSAPTWGGLTLQVTGTRGSVTIAPFAPHLGGQTEDGPVWVPLGTDLDGAMLDAFVDAVRSGRPATPDGRVGLRTLRVVDAARRSAATGEVVATVG
ncbi:Gfo/Idh/MocA family oxidoreductase [Leifsonia shinshuensis]|uniref:Gfo/Idh/MocA family protein n=1 Tax=Leifsonia shinshuensis TaxID=150026 RepID=UPI001F514253|nr:Gfo/Idh/MocA family oxidoreductase [Leifsonia shinshuensis]MCI0155127.1 Gfo/Idh/MocA family oxidoreductase [Leifsonia shinshuensis]